jgi:hypothetical protein
MYKVFNFRKKRNKKLITFDKMQFYKIKRIEIAYKNILFNLDSNKINDITPLAKFPFLNHI